MTGNPISMHQQPHTHSERRFTVNYYTASRSINGYTSSRICSASTHFICHKLICTRRNVIAQRHRILSLSASGRARDVPRVRSCSAKTRVAVTKYAHLIVALGDSLYINIYVAQQLYSFTIAQKPKILCAPPQTPSAY